MNILLLAAGEGRRFTSVGYPPKPLIKIKENPMWLHVLENFINQIPVKELKNVIVATKAHYNIKSNKYTVINLEGPQFGAAFSALQALKNINNSDELFILNVDQLVKFDWNVVNSLRDFDGGLLHFNEPNHEYKWGRSVSDGDLIKAIIEKIPVSDEAHTGHYYFADTDLFIKYAERLIQLNIKINDEFFLSPIYNLMIADGLKIGKVFVNEFIPIGIPAELEAYKEMYFAD